MNDSTTPVNERNEWRTPEALVNFCADLVGGFDYDTACTMNNMVAKPIWWDKHVVTQDAFLCEWSGRCFCNPPYDDIDPWIEKALQSNAITVLVIPSPNGEKRYSKLEWTHEYHIIGRVSFIGSNGEPRTGNPRGTSIFVLDSQEGVARSFWARNRPFQRREIVMKSDIPGRWDRSAAVWRP